MCSTNNENFRIELAPFTYNMSKCTSITCSCTVVIATEYTIHRQLRKQLMEKRFKHIYSNQADCKPTTYRSAHIYHNNKFTTAYFRLRLHQRPHAQSKYLHLHSMHSRWKSVIMQLSSAENNTLLRRCLLNNVDEPHTKAGKCHCCHQRQVDTKQTLWHHRHSNNPARGLHTQRSTTEKHNFQAFKLLLSDFCDVILPSEHSESSQYVA